MSNYKADKVTLPSVRGIPDKKGGAKGTTSDVGKATALNVTAASQDLEMDDRLLNRWVTFQAVGCTVHLVGGRLSDTTTASTTGACLKLTDGAMHHALITIDTQQVGYISTGNFTGGLVYWCSDRDT
jgi:hypothetical protein